MVPRQKFNCVPKYPRLQAQNVIPGILWLIYDHNCKIMSSSKCHKTMLYFCLLPQLLKSKISKAYVNCKHCRSKGVRNIITSRQIKTLCDLFVYDKWKIKPDFSKLDPTNRVDLEDGNLAILEVSEYHHIKVTWPSCRL